MAQAAYLWFLTDFLFYRRPKKVKYRLFENLRTVEKYLFSLNSKNPINYRVTGINVFILNTFCRV